MAAATAAQAGLKVALLEKYPLPRHKTCGGGMPVSIQSFLYDLAPEAFVESTVQHLRQTWNFADPYVSPINPPEVDRPLAIWMVQRPIFDNALAQRAVAAGADLYDGVTVRSVESDGNQMTIRATIVKPTGDFTKGAEFVATAPTVIGADGANGITAKTANLRQRRSIALAMEVEHPYDWGNGHPDLRPDVAHFEYGAIRRGYAWIFPKADHLNVGAGVFHPRRLDARLDRHVREKLKQTIFAYLKALNVPYDPEHMRFHAHPLPLWHGKESLQTADGKILLVGDAAGLINPCFGDGILHAVKSGVIAANCVVERTPAEYTDRIHAEFAANFDAALKLSRFFYQYPGLCYNYAVKNPKAAYIATQLLAGDLLFTDMVGRAIRRVRRATIGRLFSLQRFSS